MRQPELALLYGRRVSGSKGTVKPLIETMGRKKGLLGSECQDYLLVEGAGRESSKMLEKQADFI